MQLFKEKKLKKMIYVDETEFSQHISLGQAKTLALSMKLIDICETNVIKHLKKAYRCEDQETKIEVGNESIQKHVK